MRRLLHDTLLLSLRHFIFSLLFRLGFDLLLTLLVFEEKNDKRIF